MKRTICLLLALSLLLGCQQAVLSPAAESEPSAAAQIPTAQPTVPPTDVPDTPVPTEAPRPLLPSFAPKKVPEAQFAEELISKDAEPVGSMVHALTAADTLSKEAFRARFIEICRKVDALNESLLRLSEKGRTLTAGRKEKTILSLSLLMNDDTLNALQAAYSKCPGEGEDLPLEEYAASVDALIERIEGTEDRTVPFFSLGSDAAKAYMTVLERYMGEPLLPRTVLTALEDLAQTEAYAIQAALTADPEAGRKKEPISFGSFAQNITFLAETTKVLCPLPDGADLPIPHETAEEAGMELFELAFRQYPGMSYLKAYAAHAPEEKHDRWASAPDGYLAGLAVHCSHAIMPRLEDFGLYYVQYRWYADMLDVTLTGIAALLVHYYGYSQKDLAAYLEGWGAEAFTGYLYDKAMSDPFESLIASYGYHQYLDICAACLDAGCENERCFLQDYLSAGPAPYTALKEYMVGLYQKQG